MSRKALLPILLCAVLLSGCTALNKMPTWESLYFWKEKKVDSEQRETWCYRTLAAVDCYREPQNTSPERLVGVEPVQKRPQTRDDHAQALMDAAKKRH